MTSTETCFANDDSDTLDFRFSLGDRVVVTIGDLTGTEGTVIAFRADGRVLVHLRRGVYLEMLRFCLEHIHQGGEW
jgi:hypothetical protein